MLHPAPKPEPRPKRAKRPLPRVNRVRAAKRYERDFGAKGDWIRRQPCCCTGKRTGEGVRDAELGMVAVRIVAAHFPGRGAGGRKSDLVPLADHLHRRAHAHRDSHRVLERAFNVDMKALAKEYEARWQRIEAGEP